MCADRLKDLIKQADADTGSAPRMPADLAARVLRQAHRPRWRMHELSAAAALLLIAVGTWALWPARTPEPAPEGAQPTAVVDAAASQERMEQLLLEAEWRRAVALEMAEQRAAQARLASLQAQAVGPDPRDQVRASLEQAAELLVSQGDRFWLEGKQTAEAAEAYRLAAELFPRATWAAVAQARLSSLNR